MTTAGCLAASIVLEQAHVLDIDAHAGERGREPVKHEAGLDAATVQRRAARLTRLLEARHELRTANVRRKVPGRRDDVLARRKQRGDVGIELLHRHCQRRVDDTVGVERENRLSVARRSHADRREPHELAGVLAVLVLAVDIDARELELRVADDLPEHQRAHGPRRPLNYGACAVPVGEVSG